VECGRLDDHAYEAGEVRLVVEVLSPSTRELNFFGKLDEYKTVTSMQHVLLIEPNAPEAILWTRQADHSWRHSNIEGLDASIPVTGLGIELKLHDVYAGLDFRPLPRLVGGSE
jgi:Uma2 family endonuclease